MPFVQLSLAEVKKFDVGQIRPGSAYAAQFPDQHAVPGTKIPTLKELFELVRKSGDGHVRLNIETKIDPNHPGRIAADPSALSRCCSISCAPRNSRTASWCSRSTGGRCSSCRNSRPKFRRSI